MRQGLVALVTWAESVSFLALSLRPLRRSGPLSHSVLLAAPGQGNVGDQAMLESFLTNVDGKIRVVVSSASSLVIPENFADRVTLVELTHLIYGHGPRFGLDLIRLRETLRGARLFAVIGADVMDGAYKTLASVRRFDVARFAGRLGLESHVLGFSWNENPSVSATRAMQRSISTTTFFARGPQSAARMRHIGATNVVDAADLVFSFVPQDVAKQFECWQEAQGEGGRDLIVANVNSLVEKHVAQVEPFRLVLGQLIDSGCSVLIVPHDPRNSPSDVELANRLNSALASPHARVAPLGWTPSEIFALVKSAKLVITGRMHLAILSLLAGTPAISISYQGKVEGLYQLLGLDEFWIRPESNFEAELGRVVAKVLRDEAQVRGAIRSNLPRVVRLSGANFAPVEPPGRVLTSRAS